MKLEVKNIGLIREAEIELDGVTVLTGFNGTGKSTVSKSLYGIMVGYADLPKKIMKERTESIRKSLSDYLDHITTSSSSLHFNTDLNNMPYDEESPLFHLPSLWAEKKESVPESCDDFFSRYFPHLKYVDSELARKLYPIYAQGFTNVINRSEKEYSQFVLGRDIIPFF